MSFFISTLINGPDSMEDLASWVNSQPYPGLGVEMIAFTHDKNYWARLIRVLEKLKCPVSFHGPYIGVEATSKKGTKEWEWLFESYQKVFALAKEYNIKHVVFHYTQLGFDNNNIETAKKSSGENIHRLIEMANDYNINMLIENLPFPRHKLSLYNNDEYAKIFMNEANALSIIDIGHANINKLDLEKLMQGFADRVKAYHFHNNDGIRDLHNCITNGTFNYKMFSYIFKRYTPEADIVLEYEPHTNLSKEELLDDLHYIDKLMNQH